MSEPAHTGSPPLSISGSYPPLPVLSPSSPTQRQSFSSGPSTNDTPQLYGDRQTYSRRTISFREEDEDDEEDDDDDDDVIEIKTPSRRSSSSSLSSAGKLSPTTGKYPLLAEQPREISRPKEDTPDCTPHNRFVSYATDRLSATSPTAQQSALVSGNDSRSSSANTSDRTTTKRVPRGPQSEVSAWGASCRGLHLRIWLWFELREWLAVTQRKRTPVRGLRSWIRHVRISWFI